MDEQLLKQLTNDIGNILIQAYGGSPRLEPAARSAAIAAIHRINAYKHTKKCWHCGGTKNVHSLSANEQIPCPKCIEQPSQNPSQMIKTFRPKDVGNPQEYNPTKT